MSGKDNLAIYYFGLKNDFFPCKSRLRPNYKMYTLKDPVKIFGQGIISFSFGPYLLHTL